MEQRVREMQDQLVKGLRKVAVAPRNSHLEVVAARGAVAPGNATAMPVRITTDPHAANAILVDRDKNFPHRQKDVVTKLKARLPDGHHPNTYNLQTINRVFDVADNEAFSWKPQFSARQYSDAYVEWVAQQVSADENFLQKTRRRFQETNGRLAALDGLQPAPKTAGSSAHCTL